jgi:hypothetical protein
MAKRQAQKKDQKKVEETSAVKPDEGLPPEAEGVVRRRLLAQLAGNVAAGIFASPNEPPSTAAGVAEIAVDVAEAILQKVDL